MTERGFDIKDRNGNNVDPTTIEWGRLSTNNFPYTLVQRPGPYNAMGRVKFMFPNQYSVYLHDTPSRYLFEREARAFSAGCIRTEPTMSGKLACEMVGKGARGSPLLT